MPDLRDGWNFFLGKYLDSTAEKGSWGAVTYVLLNTIAFAVSLMVVVILLLLPNHCLVPCNLPHTRLHILYILQVI
jgi:hypothetical protein